MSIRFACPNCNQTMKAPPHLAGRVMPCPQCRNPLVVPGGAPPVIPTAVPVASPQSAPFSFDPATETPAASNYRRPRGQNQASIWMTVGGCVLIAVVVAGFLLLKGGLKSSGGSGGSGLTVSDFKSAVSRLNKN